MYSGPEHYEAAERLLEAAGKLPAGNDDTNPAAALMIAEAQVHATLAHAAATALCGFKPGTQAFLVSAGSVEAWERAAGGGGPRGASYSNGPLEPRSLRDLPRTETIFNLLEPRPYQ
jgi:hypothetical protein